MRIIVIFYIMISRNITFIIIKKKIVIKQFDNENAQLIVYTIIIKTKINDIIYVYCLLLFRALRISNIFA